MKYIILLIISSIVGCSYQRQPLITGFEGKLLPSFTILLPDSTTYINTKTIPTGKPFFIFCFGPDCPYSRDQMNEILNNISFLRNIRFYVITPWPFTEMRKFAEEFKLKDYCNITVGHDVSDFFENYYKIPGIPYLVFYQKDKKLNKSFVGKVHAWQIKDIIENDSY